MKRKYTSQSVLNRRLASFPQTDLGNVDRLAERYRGRLLWCGACGWLQWDGTRWSADGAEEAVAFAEEDTIRRIIDEANAIEAEATPLDQRRVHESDYLIRSLREWQTKSEHFGRLGLAKRARIRFSIPLASLDRDPYKFNAANGTVCVEQSKGLWRWRFKPHDPRDLITMRSDVLFDSAAQCPRYDKVIAHLHTQEGVRLLHQWIGMSLTGDTSEQVFLWNVGQGSNGKSTMFQVYLHIAGGYGASTPIETLLKSGRLAHGATPDLARLNGKRLVLASEPGRGSHLDDSLLKLITGGEKITARQLYGEPYEMSVHLKLAILANHPPSFPKSNFAMDRRCLVLPWTRTISEAERDPHLADKLKSEASGILNHLLHGLIDWLNNGLAVGAKVGERQGEGYRGIESVTHRFSLPNAVPATDHLSAFLRDATASKIGARTQARELYNGYQRWCHRGAHEALSLTAFGLGLRQRGVHKRRVGRVYYLDIVLND